jgi:hypothetical protein
MHYELCTVKNYWALKKDIVQVVYLLLMLFEKQGVAHYAL